VLNGCTTFASLKSLLGIEVNCPAYKDYKEYTGYKSRAGPVPACSAPTPWTLNTIASLRASMARREAEALMFTHVIRQKRPMGWADWVSRHWSPRHPDPWGERRLEKEEEEEEEEEELGGV